MAGKTKTKFITFQPQKVADTLNEKEVYTAPFNSQLLGKENKIFCLRVDEHTIERIFLCAPSMPQVAILFETDKFEEIDSIEWVNKIFLGIDKKINSKYKEYTVDKIEKKDVISIDTISFSDNPDVVQDDFMNEHFKELEKLSEHKWYRLADRDDFWKSPKAIEFVEQMSLCMMPYRELTEKDYDKAVNLVRDNFIKR